MILHGIVQVSGAEGQRMKEAQNINKSLAALGDVLRALAKYAAASWN